MRGKETSGLPAEREATAVETAEPAGSPEQQPTASHPSAATYALIERELDDATNVLAAEGELDLASAPSLKWGLTDALKDGATKVVVDLSLVTFIDSTALGVLVGVHRSLPVGARLAIVCANDDVMNIFELTGLDATFDIFRTLDDALAFVRGRTAAAR